MTEKGVEEDWKSKTVPPTNIIPTYDDIEYSDEEGNSMIYTETDIENNLIDTSSSATQAIFRFCDDKALTICEYLSVDTVLEFVQNWIRY